jgi:hypothetical protein
LLHVFMYRYRVKSSIRMEKDITHPTRARTARIFKIGDHIIIHF